MASAGRRAALAALDALAARWPALRASLIALAIALGLVEGCPIPEKKHAPAWSHDAIDDVAAARRTILEPVAWIGRDLEIQQRWALFRGASRKRYRMYVEARTATGDWQLLYRAGDDDHDAYGDLLAYRRVRGTYSPSGPNVRGQYSAFATWMTLRVLDDHPEYAVARTRMEKLEIGDDGYTPTGEFTMERQEPRRRK